MTAITPHDQTRITELRLKAVKADVQLHIFDDHDTDKSVFLVGRWFITRQIDSLLEAEQLIDKIIATGAARSGFLFRVGGVR
jgi:hypothetical protein